LDKKFINLKLKNINIDGKFQKINGLRIKETKEALEGKVVEITSEKIEDYHEGYVKAV
jgi:DNA helicase TIP49 (TBP-interacting protein)